MTNEKVFNMSLNNMYNALLAKAQRKGCCQAEVDEIICWLTGYSAQELTTLVGSDISYGDFFRNAPEPNPKRELIRGSVCGVRVEEVEDPLMREIRRLDKLIDELAKGKPLEKILRQ